MPESKLKVLQVIINLEIGGAQEVVRTLVEYLAASGCLPMVCTFKDGPIRHEIEQLGVQVEVLDPPRHSIVALPLFIIDMIRIWQALVRLVREYDIDVVQTHLLRSLDFLTLFLPYVTDLGVVLWTFHSVNFLPTKRDALRRYQWLSKPKRYAYRLLYRLASRQVSGCVAVSDQVRESMLKLIGPIRDKITVICNGVDVARYQQPVDRGRVRRQLGFSSEEKLLITVGTLKEEKGHQYLIEAATKVVHRYPNAHFLFVGDGERRSVLQAQANACGLSERIHFLGNRQDVSELLIASDVFVLPSFWEGLSMALLEAMAAGLPIVASEVSGTVQVVAPNETGILVPPGDAQRLARAIDQVLADPTQAQAMGAAARRRIEEEFSARKQADEYLSLYRRLL
jgi:glycosyltransferase involved in cell wall biosynthesis